MERIGLFLIKFLVLLFLSQSVIGQTNYTAARGKLSIRYGRLNYWNGSAFVPVSDSTTAAGKADLLHNHVVADVTNLQTLLDGKLTPTGNGSGLTGLTSSQVGLGNVTNESKSTMFNSPTFTGTVGGITKSMVGLSNVDNTSDADKPVSTATQTALDGKQSTLQSATNIKTINGSSILGSGDLVVSGAASWGSITGLLASQLDLTAALALKADLISPVFTGTVTLPSNTVTNSMLAGSIAQSKITNYAGYTINVQALTSSPADNGTVYFGMLPKAPITTANVSKVYIRQAGTINGAEIYCYSGTAGTAESWSLYVRVNNTTDHLIATVSAATSERVFSNTGLNISVNAGDYIEIKSVQPTWATNPLTTIYGGYIRIN